VAEPLSPTTKVLIAGGAVVAGVIVLSMVQAKGGIRQLLGLPAAPLTAAEQAAVAAAQAAAQAKVAVPTQAGVTFRSGSVGGFIPIPFDKIISSVFSIFQPSKSEAAQITAPAGYADALVPTPSPLVEQIQQAVLGGATIGGGTGPEQPVESWWPAEEPALIQADGSVFTPADYGDAGQQFYSSGEMEIGSEYTEYWW
jgi:hypothetical protein